MFEKNKQLISQVLDIVDDKHIFIAAPILNNVIVPIPIGSIIRIIYFKKNMGVFSFVAKVVGRKNIEDIYYLKIQRTGNIEKTQRRNFFRLDAVLKATINVLKGNEKEGMAIEALIKDISGGGAKIISKVRLEPESIIHLKIHIERGVIIAEGKVIRCIPFKHEDYPYEIGVIFENLHESIRNEIISFIFEYQRKMRKKGLI
ncbi:MAG: PilZ domain-containing protein [Thermotaleaceae bacterium]